MCMGVEMGVGEGDPGLHCQHNSLRCLGTGRMGERSQRAPDQMGT